MDKISKKPSKQAKMRANLIKVEVADPAHGHQTLMLKPERLKNTEYPN